MWEDQKEHVRQICIFSKVNFSTAKINFAKEIHKPEMLKKHPIFHSYFGFLSHVREFLCARLRWYVYWMMAMELGVKTLLFVVVFALLTIGINFFNWHFVLKGRLNKVER